METFQQPKITGYRQLSQDEAALMNDIKALGQKIESHIAMIQSHLRTQFSEAQAKAGDDAGKEFTRLQEAEPARWVSIAKTDFQTALMALTRSVAQPSSF